VTEIQQMIQAALVRYRRILRNRASLTFLGTFALVMALAALLDRQLIFSGWMRWIGWIGGLVASIWAARHAVGSACPDAGALAHRVELEAGETVPVVATAIDPAVRRTAEREACSKILLERLDLRATEAVRVAPPTFKGLLRKPAIFAVLALAGLVALLALQGGQGLRRMLLPWQPSPYTLLVLEGPAEAVAEGRAFTLTAKVSGLPVETITLYRQGSTEPLAEAAPDEQGLVRLAVEGLDGPADFVARGGDGWSEPLRVEPYLLPTIEAFEILVTPPKYALHAGGTETKPTFSALRGSTLRYRIHLKAPANSVLLERSAGPRKEEWVTDQERATLKRGLYGVLEGPKSMDDIEPPESLTPDFRPDPVDPLVWEANWDLSNAEDMVYRLAITGKHADLVRNDESWRINVLWDTPPKVRIRSHNGGDVIHTGKETVRFELSAVDDVRLAKVRLVFRKPGDPHVLQEILLPSNTQRTWSGAELLDLAPLNLGMLDLVAVHVEAEDANTLDGPGVGRSKVVYLEVPLPESDDDGDGDGGGAGGSGPPPINPLELQMEILRSTVGLPTDAPASEQAAIAHDQHQNAEYTGQLEQATLGSSLTAELGAALGKARLSMKSAARVLDTQSAFNAVPPEEVALGWLIEASKILEEVKGELPPVESAEGEGMLSFTLSAPKPKGGSSSEGEEKEGDKEREALKNLMEEVKRQLAEQEALNQGEAETGELADRQESLAEDARSAASQARGIPSSAGLRGDPRAAAEELERAAGLQDDTAEALAGEDSATSTNLGAKSAEALNEALRELAAQLETENYDTEAHPPGYERLINDYLRSISYE